MIPVCCLVMGSCCLGMMFRVQKMTSCISPHVSYASPSTSNAVSPTAAFSAFFFFFFLPALGLADVLSNDCKTRRHTVLYCTLHHTTKCRHESVEISSKMQPCNRIYYSKVYWRLSMLLLIIRSSKLYLQPLVYIYTWWTAIVSLDNGRSRVYINQRL